MPSDTWRPCPFCGGTDLIRYDQNAFLATRDEDWVVECLTCACQGPRGATPDEAVTRWTRRPVRTG